MSKVKFTRKRDAIFFRSLKLVVNGSIYNLKRNGSIEVDLPEGIYEVCATLDWCYANHSVDLTGRDSISLTISQNIPNWYYLTSISILFVLFILVFIDKIPLWVFTTPLGLYFIPLMANMIVNRRKFFKFT